MQQDRISDALLPPSAAPGTRLGQALLWQPSYVRDEKILWHVPFLFWLLEATRPRQYLEIGVGEGVAYMAVCQALHRMRAHSQCYAVGDWKQEDGSIQVPERLAARNADLYEDFSQILRYSPDEAARAIEDGSIDLMLVDLTRAQKVAPSFHKRWMPKLAKNGILLLNGIDGGDEATAVLVNSLSEKSPTVRMPGGDGLLVVLPGRDPDEELANIAALSPADPAHKLIVQMFTRLGAGTYYETHVGADEERSSTLEAQICSLTEERDRLAESLSDLNGQYDARHRKVALLQSRHFDLELALTAVKSQAEELGKKLSTAETKLEQTQKLREEFQNALRAERSDRAEAEWRLDEAQRLLKDKSLALSQVERSQKVELEALQGEADLLRARVAELTLHKDREYRAVKELIEVAEQNDNLITALTEEVHALRHQAHAFAAAADNLEARQRAAKGGWLNRLAERSGG